MKPGSCETTRKTFEVVEYPILKDIGLVNSTADKQPSDEHRSLQLSNFIPIRNESRRATCLSSQQAHRRLSSILLRDSLELLGILLARRLHD
jgi:hypothetical protein